MVTGQGHVSPLSPCGHSDGLRMKPCVPSVTATAMVSQRSHVEPSRVPCVTNVATVVASGGGHGDEATCPLCHHAATEMTSGDGHSDRTRPRVPSVTNVVTVVASGGGHSDRTRPRVPSVTMRPQRWPQEVAAVTGRGHVSPLSPTRLQ